MLYNDTTSCSTISSLVSLYIQYKLCGKMNWIVVKKCLSPLANLHHWGENVTADTKHKADEGPIVLSTMTHAQEYRAH